MNTPAHVVFGLSLLGRANAWQYTAAIIVGSLLPDAGMVVFYAWQKIIGTPEAEIWNSRYFDPAWQNVFDLANSFPLIGLGLLVAWRWKSRQLGFLFAAMTIHCLLDLLFHHDDGHRHFYPLSQWRFQSPVSYWDPAHHGNLVGSLEVALVVVGAIWLWCYKPASINRPHWRQKLPLTLIATSLVYAVYFWFVQITWVNTSI